jgi:hypothetical protein
LNPDLLRRRGGSHNARGRAADMRAGVSKQGGALVEHFMTRNVEDIETLSLDLDPRRRHVAMLDLSADELAVRLSRHAACLPDELHLHVRFSRKYDCPLSPLQLEALRPRVQFGTPERDVGPFPLLQVAEVAAPMNRVRIGRATALVRAALASVQVVRQFVNGSRT